VRRRTLKGNFVSDIFREVEEEVRRERFEKLWKDYGDYIVAGACLLVIAAAGIQLWRTYDQRQRIKASDEYAAAEQMLEGGATAQAADAFGRLADTAPGGYKALARLQHADALMASGERGDALNLYKQIAAGDDELLGAVARIHAAWAIVDFAPRAQVQSTLGPLTVTTSAWRPMAGEVLAYWDYRTGALKPAQAEYEAIVRDSNAPQPLRERANVMAAFLKAGGDRNYGTVPAPPKQPEPPQSATPVDPGAVPSGPPTSGPNPNPNPSTPRP
jgi:hypothetical protein